ncbi:hypothetical protein [Pseudomonas sp. DSP3-2-2]|uniref:hypothetical protein n=1 Tax=unclassified Pseudomonas TaxID=196821 RepID=UPI003CEBD299
MTIIITAKRNGFRRFGIAHSDQPTPYADDHFTEEQLKALLLEPQLIIAYKPGEPDRELTDVHNSQVPAPQASSAPQEVLPQSPAPSTASIRDAGGQLLVDAGASTDAESALVATAWDEAHLEHIARESAKRLAEADACWDEAHQEYADRDAAALLPAKVPAKAHKPKADKPKDDAK